MAHRFLLVTEAARVLEVAATTVREMDRDGRLKALKTPTGVRLFDANEVSKLAAERKRGKSEQGFRQG
jgi:excisionase family DNA binding protein